MECRVTSPEKTSIANLRTKSWKTARLTARIASTALLLQSTRATAPPCTMAMARATAVAVVEAGEAAAAVGRALRKQSGEQEAVQSQMMQTCKVMFKEVCHEEWITSFTEEVYIMAVGFARNDRVDLLLSLLSKNRKLYHLFLITPSWQKYYFFGHLGCVTVYLISVTTIWKCFHIGLLLLFH